VRLLRARTAAPAPAQPAPGALIPARTGFDFLDGAFRSDERARLKGLTALGTTGLLLVTVAFGSVTLGAQNSSVRAELEQANRQVSNLSVELGQLSNTGGLGERELAARLQVLRSQLDQVSGDQVQVLTIVNGLQAVMPPGAQITSIELRRSDAGVQRLTVQVALETFTRLTALSEGIASIWYLSDTAVSWNSGGDRVAVTIRADIDPGLLEGPVPALQEQVAAALAGVSPVIVPTDEPSPDGGEN
jgi:hypothetical protein